MRTGSTDELCFKLFFELKRGKRLFLMLGFLPSQPSVWNIRRTERPAAHCRKRQTCLLLKTADEHAAAWLNVCKQRTQEADSTTDILPGCVLVSICKPGGNTVNTLRTHTLGLFWVLAESRKLSRYLYHIYIHFHICMHVCIHSTIDN